MHGLHVTIFFPRNGKEINQSDFFHKSGKTFDCFYSYPHANIESERGSWPIKSLDKNINRLR